MGMDLKAVLIPPIIAILLYLGCMYLLVPLYRQRQQYSQYLPMALMPSDQPGMMGRTRRRVQEALADFATNRFRQRRASATSEDFNLGDEELDEVVVTHHLSHPGRERTPDGGYG